MLISKALSLVYLSVTSGFIIPIVQKSPKFQLNSRVGIIDSHIDFDGDLASKAFKNEECHIELESQDLICEVTNGRNFHSPANQTKPNFINDKSADVIKYFSLIKKKKKSGFLNIFESAWIHERHFDKDFIDQVTVYKKNSHGTHVAGIAAKDNDDIELVQMSIIPHKSEHSEEQSIDVHHEDNSFSLTGEQMDNIEEGLEEYLESLSRQYQNIATYAKFFDIKIINGSYGIPGFKESILSKCYKKNLRPPKVQINYLEQKYVQKFNKAIREKLEQSSDTLYVFAAGNHAADIDKFPTMPASIKSDQTITVASVSKKQTLSKFSCWGKRNVDIAAYGELIRSIGPGNVSMMMTGTSQAAPQVTNVASLLKDKNEDLKPSEIKYLIMHTVDHIKSLEEKIKSGGILNKARALKAVSYLNNGFSLVDACLEAYVDLPENFEQQD